MNKSIIKYGRLINIKRSNDFIICYIHTELKRIQLKIMNDLLVNKTIKNGTLVRISGKLDSFKGTSFIKVEEIQVIVSPTLEIPDILLDTDKRFRKRYVDFLLNDKSMALLNVHIYVYKYIRQYLWNKDIDEIRPPMISTVHASGNSFPFTTHINSIDCTAFLSPTYELEIKEVLATRLKSVFVLGSNFRNEGYDTKHLPEFQLLEIGHILSDINETVDLVKGMIDFILDSLKNMVENCYIQENLIKQTEWNFIDVRSYLQSKYNLDINCPKENLLSFCKKYGIDSLPSSPIATIINSIIGRLIGEKNSGLTILSNLPTEVSPLIKDNSERYWIFINTVDVCDIYVANDDRESIVSKLQEQNHNKSKTDSRPVDKMIDLYEYGVVPHNMVGFSVSRFLQAILMFESIKETPLFKIQRV